MEYIKMDRIALPISKIIFGAATRELIAGENSDGTLDYVISEGINTIDTARSYGDSEVALGTFMNKRKNRNKLNILTKGCNPHMTGVPVTKDTMREELEQSLKNLQTDHVEFYGLHRDDTAKDVSLYIDVLNEFVQEGKVLNFGASNWSHERMKEANDYAKANNLQGFSFGSPAFSLAEVIGDPWGGSVKLSGDSKKEARDWFVAEGIPVFAYSSLARGFFSGKYRTDMAEPITSVLIPETCEEYAYPDNIERLRRAEILGKEKQVTVSQICLAWMLHHPLTVCPITSSSSIKHLEDNLKGVNLKLSKEECGYLNLED